uniref:[Histone H3]-trimethyl-L-lysine(9) demethylase n=1 Tax=Syphacia muris TaxID=451379 RepID=A0A0N5AWR7_9BILA
MFKKYCTSNASTFPEWKSTGTVEVPVFYPTMEEMKDFCGYVKKIEEEHKAHLVCGIAKIVPPPEYSMRKSRDYSDVDNYVIEQPVKERVDGQGGIYCKTNKLYRRSMTVKELRILANKMRCPVGNNTTPAEIEKYYWKTVLLGEPVYGADTPGSICDPDLKEFNLNRLGTILDMLNNYEIKIKGVNTVYLYFGMWKTTFPWHTEDMDLYSINYIHFGEPKFWYAIATDCNDRFERFAAQRFPAAAKACKSFLRHKNFIISPQVLRKNNIKFGTMIHRANEFIITFPRGYHMGFNMGYNCAESTNFASDRWIDYGKNASVCSCRPDSVEIDMRPFMEQFRPDEYKEWLQYWYGERVIKDRNSAISTVERKRVCTEYGVRELWSYLPPNLYAEKEFNNRKAAEAPHCAVCQYFVPPAFMERKKCIPVVNGFRSKRYVKRAWFAKKNPDLFPEDECEDRLFRCSNCYVVVHQGCYPIGSVPAGKNCESGFSWRCARCRYQDDNAIRNTSCNLCELRGGALIPLEDSGGDFVHVICALLNRRTVFTNAETLASAYTQPLLKLRKPAKYDLEKDYKEAFGINCERGKFQCDYCQNSREGLLKCFVCEETMFHATCGRMAGISFEFRKWPDLTVAICLHEDDNRVSIGDKVRVAIRDFPGRLFKGIVTNIDRQECCTVHFMDRNWSDDLPPEDIVDCECKKLLCNGWHVSGAKIKIKWDDGIIYDGIFRYRYIRSTFTVQLSAKYSYLPKTVKVTREAVFARGEKPVGIQDQFAATLKALTSH